MMWKVVLFALCWKFIWVLSNLNCPDGICDNEIRQRYEPTWNSLDKRPLPEWYDDAKIGIFIHWGVYSVPSYGSEWFWNYWEGQQTKPYIDFMKKNYKPGFTYQDFANEFTAELFNSTEWALLFNDSGAKYIVLTSKHHEGFTLWPSSHSFSWNAMDVGPKRNIVDELASSIRSKTSIKFGLYYSLFEWFNRMYLDDRKHKFQTQNYVQKKMMPELFDLVNEFQPDILWSDGFGDAHAEYWNSTNFIAWLYNDSPVRDTIVTNDRWGSDTICKHGDFYTCFDRYNPGRLVNHKWENALTIDKTTWGHRSDTKLKNFLTIQELITEIVSTVSCGGNININIGPTKAGTIEVIFEERLRQMGQWLRVNGEAIYSSRPWKYQNDTGTNGVWYTMQKRNSSSDRLVVYAIILKYPYDENSINLYSMIGQVDDKTKISLLGLPNEELRWTSYRKYLHVELPLKNRMDEIGLDYAWTLKINIPTK